ncbi:hypothetical protein D0862_12245 [Hortaea werneckii]|uniref:BTB domain-containing protein n=1 Tax=Hortaea werneckii TaxID=91943 RepID=A0A3M7EYR5_HORWE|nr:hypothetical protein D0862_12245 [Hortaea werneckii]
MQPGNNPNAIPAQSNGPRRPTGGRIVPAIPLPLSKPRPARGQSLSQPQQQQSPVAREGGTTTGQQNYNAARSSAQPAKDAPAAVNGLAHPPTEARVLEDAVHTDDVKAKLEKTSISQNSAAMSTSRLQPTVAPNTESAQGPASLQSAGEPGAVAPTGSNTQPLESFDMRPLRTELPPAFVPTSSEQPAFQSAGTSMQQFPAPPGQGHPSQQSMGSIIFGGQDSSSPSPVPPQSGGSVYQPPSYSAFGNVPTQQFNHAHHMSEPYGPRSFGQGYVPPPGAWNMRQAYQPQPPWYPSPAPQQQFRYPPYEPFMPNEQRQPNGHFSRSRSASQTSSGPPKAGDDLQSPVVPEGASDRAPYDLPTTPFMPGPPNLRHYHPNHPAPPPPMPQPDMGAAYENSQGLRDHVLSQFANPTFADCHLRINDDNLTEEQHIDGHTLILCRSPTLHDLVRSAASTGTKSEVDILLKGRYLSTRAFTDSMRYLYGGPLQSLDQLRQPAGPDMYPSNEQCMELALQHIATGAWLRVPVIASKSLDIAGSLIHWDTIPTLLAFALEGGLSPIWTIDDGSEDRSSTSSSDDSFSRPDTLGRPTHDPYSTQLLHRMIEFIVHLLPPNFYVDSSASQLTTCPRLPSMPHRHEGKSSRSDPRLSKIRFGEVPAEDHQRPSPATTTISSLLLSLPFALLKCILEHDLLAMKLGPDTVASIMRQVIAEREARRKKVLQARPTGRAEDASDAPLLPNLFWEEEVEASAQHRVGLRLARRRRGIETPPSSATVSE